MQNADNEALLFIDLLGFASLTEEYEVDLAAIKRRTGPIWGRFADIFGPPDDPLTIAFSEFHQCLQHAIQFAQIHHSLHAITFSDSAFIATKRLHQAVDIGSRIIQTLMRRGIPARAGIGYGSFSVLRYRSDVTADNSDHASHFLGRGVVRSHAAEKCGIKGMRLLLHPSAAELLGDSFHNPVSEGSTGIPYLRCTERESKNDVRVNFEIDYWRLKVGEEKDTWHAFQDMWDKAPGAVLQHYQDTAAAIDRMRVGQGKQPLNNLRRRTLPR